MRMCCVLLGDCRTCFFSNNSFLLRVGAVAYSGRGDEPRHYWHMASLAASFLSPLVHSITGGYCYTGDLCQLDGRRPREVPFSLPGFQSVSSPLRDCLPAWRENLRGHPDPCFVNYLLCGIEHGFRVGFDYSRPLRSAQNHMLSADLHPGVVDQYVDGEVAKGRIVGPVAVSVEAARAGVGLHLNRMGVVPKGHTHFEAHFQFEVEAVYLPGKVNTLADDLSRNRSSSFLCKAPQMRREPSRVPPQLPRLLFGGIDWTSPLWTATFTSMCTGV